MKIIYLHYSNPVNSGSDADHQHDPQGPELAEHVRRRRGSLVVGLLHLAGPRPGLVQRHHVAAHLHQALHQKEGGLDPIQSLPEVRS